MININNLKYWQKASLVAQIHFLKVSTVVLNHSNYSSDSGSNWTDSSID